MARVVKVNEATLLNWLGELGILASQVKTIEDSVGEALEKLGEAGPMIRRFQMNVAQMRGGIALALDTAEEEKEGYE